MRQLFVLPFVLLSLVACRGEDSRPQGVPEPYGPNMSGHAPRQMSNCPSAVPGAVTKVDFTAGGVDITVTAASPDVQRRIAELAAFHAHSPTVFATRTHNGLRGGGHSRVGYCPIVHAGATVTTSVVPNGVRIHLRADDLTQVKELQDTVSARAARLPGFASS
jgi:hypothetical protein